MTLKYLLNIISRRAINQKCINYASAGSDIYQLNVVRIEDYPVLFTSPTGNHMVSENTTIYELTLYYLDRLTEDNLNDIDIQSVAIEQLKNIVLTIGQIDGVVRVSEAYSITNFIETEAFNDRLAGGYCTIQVEVLNNFVCPDE